MFDSILAFGDSHVAGAELNGPESNEAKDQAFPAILGRKWNVPVYNFAWTGGSNDRSLRLLPEKLLQYPNSLVIFFYSDFSRNEYFRPDLPDYLPTDSTGYSPLGINWEHSSTPSITRKLIKMYYKNFYHDTSEFNNYREYNTLLTVQLFCEKYAKDYVQIFGFPGNAHNKVSAQKTVLDHINMDKILKFPENTWSCEGWNLGYGNLMEWVEQSKFPQGIGHMLHDGHQALADLIQIHLETKNDI